MKKLIAFDLDGILVARKDLAQKVGDVSKRFNKPN